MRTLFLAAGLLAGFTLPSAAADCRAAIKDAEQWIASAPDLSSVETELPLHDCLRETVALEKKLRAVEKKVRSLIAHFDQAPRRQAE